MASTSSAARFDRYRRWYSTVGSLSRADRKVLVLAWGLLPLIRMSLATFGVRRTVARRGAASAPTSDGTSERPSPRVFEIVRLVATAARHTPVANTCLHRSLVLCWLLRREGFECRMRLLTRRQDGRFEAHASVEHAGVLVSEVQPEDRDYIPLAWQGTA